MVDPCLRLLQNIPEPRARSFAQRCRRLAAMQPVPGPAYGCGLRARFLGICTPKKCPPFAVGMSSHRCSRGHHLKKAWVSIVNMRCRASWTKENHTSNQQAVCAFFNVCFSFGKSNATTRQSDHLSAAHCNSTLVNPSVALILALESVSVPCAIWLNLSMKADVQPLCTY